MLYNHRIPLPHDKVEVLLLCGKLPTDRRIFMIKTKKLVLYALFTAIHVVLCYASINLGNMKITISGLPIIIGAMLFGPMAGLEIGLLGSLLNQLLTYGLTLTTVLWIIPAG